MKNIALFLFVAVILGMSAYATQLSKSPKNNQYITSTPVENSKTQQGESGSLLGLSNESGLQMKNLGKVEGFAVASLSSSRTELEIAASLPDLVNGQYDVLLKRGREELSRTKMKSEKGGYIATIEESAPLAKGVEVWIVASLKGQSEVEESLFSLELE